MIKCGSTLLRTVLILVSTFLLSPAQARNFFEDLYGVATDPLKLGQASSELSSSLERTLIQLDALEGKANYDVQMRLEQIRSILKDAVSGTQETIAYATASMNNLEAKINTDAVNLIYRSQCLTETVLMDQLQRSFAMLINNLKKANPGVSILGIRIISGQLDEITIEHPDTAYITTKKEVLSSLSKSVTDNSKAYAILSAYQNLENAAKFVRCHYLDQASESIWVSEVNEFERLSLPWVNAKPSL